MNWRFFTILYILSFKDTLDSPFSCRSPLSCNRSERNRAWLEAR